jgi:hypothetical protein
MPRTHYLPADYVHYKWDIGNEPVITIDSGDTVVFWTRGSCPRRGHSVPDSFVHRLVGAGHVDLRLDWVTPLPLHRGRVEHVGRHEPASAGGPQHEELAVRHVCGGAVLQQRHRAGRVRPDYGEVASGNDVIDLESEFPAELGRRERLLEQGADLAVPVADSHPSAITRASGANNATAPSTSDRVPASK